MMKGQKKGGFVPKGMQKGPPKGGAKGKTPLLRKGGGWLPARPIRWTLMGPCLVALAAASAGEGEYAACLFSVFTH